MGSEYPDAIDMFVDRSRVFQYMHPSGAIVIHGTGSPGETLPTAQEIQQYFATTSEETSSHFIIGRDGVVIQAVHLYDGAAANCCVEEGHDPFWNKYISAFGNLNYCTISIEHVNDVQNSVSLTTAQKLASFKLVKWLMDRYNIDANHIKSHGSIAPISRANCPGNYPWTELESFIGKNSGIPLGWVDDGKTLTAPNGKQVIQGFRDFILSNQWSASDWPLDLSHGMQSGGTQQTFTYSRLEWNPSKGVYKVALGKLALDNKL